MYTHSIIICKNEKDDILEFKYNSENDQENSYKLPFVLYQFHNFEITVEETFKQKPRTRGARAKMLTDGNGLESLEIS